LRYVLGPYPQSYSSKKKNELLPYTKGKTKPRENERKTILRKTFYLESPTTFFVKLS
jgi:hypothetical protein